MLTNLFPPLERPLVCLDTETHAFVPPEKSHIIELGFKVFYPDKEPLTWVGFIKPPVPITAEATAKHHITNEMVADAPTWEQAGPRIAHGFAGADFLGYNLRFDLTVIGAEMSRCRIKWSIEGARFIDPLRLWQIAAPRTLSDAVKEFCGGRTAREAHRALGDAEDAHDVAVGQLERWNHLPRDIQRLHDLQFPPPPPGSLDRENKLRWEGSEVVINFGKHQGTLLRKMPSGYLKWMRDEGNFDSAVKTIVAEALQGRYPKKEN